MTDQPILRNICPFHSIRHLNQVSNIFQSSINESLSASELASGTRLGIDSHADTTCVNKHAYIEHVVEGMTVDAIPFDKSIGKLEQLPIVHAIFAYDNPATFRTHLLRFNHSIYIKTMENSLLCPNQAREHGIIVDDIPPSLDHTGHSTFSITSDDTDMPLHRCGPTSFLHVRRPTEAELATLDIIDMTSPDSWDPYPDGNPATIQLSSITTSPSLATDPIDDALLFRPYRRIAAMNISKPRDKLTADYLSQIWHCGKKTAEKTIQASTCRHYRNITRGMTRRFRPSRDMFRYRLISRPVGEFYTDTLFSSIRSARGYTCAQIYGNKYGWSKVYPMESKKKQPVGDSLTLLIQDVGVPQSLHTDNAPEMVGRSTPFFRRARKEGIDLTTIEPGRPNENYGEILVKQAKVLTAKLMRRHSVPLRLWCYCLEYASDLNSLIVRPMFRTKGRSGYEIVFGHTPDISEYVEFIFYSYCWYWDNPQSFPQAKKQLGRWLGVAQRVGQAMVFNIMGFNGKVLARSTVIPLEPDEYDDPTVKQQIAALDVNIDKALGDTQNATTTPSATFPDQSDYDSQLSFLFDLESSDFNDLADPHFSNPEIPDVDDAPNHDVESEEFDKFLGLHVEIPAGDGSKNVLAKVQERKRDHDGNLIGRYNENPILNTAVYNVRSPDGTLHEYTANVISQRIFDQVDDDGWNYDLLYEIVNHRTDKDAVPPDKGYYDGPDGQRKRVITTKGWQLQVQWENGETTWISLKDIKESNPVEVAEYAIKEKIDSWPAFAWWVPRILKKRDAIVCKTSHKTRRMMKFGIPIPKDYEEAVKFDRANYDTLWQDSTAKEMKNIEVAFKFLDDGGDIPIGFKEITCHLIYDVKFTLDCKARYVAGGHRTKVDPSMTYSSVVSRDSVRIMFLVAALNDLDIAMCDIGNAYLQAETRERVWFKAGKEWGSRAGQKVIVTRALYGLRASGAEWKKTFSDFIRHILGYEPCIGADDNIYRKAETKTDGSTYYAYIVVYVDDVLALHEHPNKIMDLIHKEFRLKNPPEAPTMYLGADISRYDLPDEEFYKSCWAMSADSHIKKALQMLETNMLTDGLRFRPTKKTAEHPFSSTSYRPELDISDPCTPEQTQFYQSNIGILLWLVELGRLDILTETSLLSSHLAAPRTGHLHQTLSIFKYLKDHNRSRIIFDPNMTNINDDHLPPEERALTKALWMAELYPDAQQYYPPNAPKPRGQPVQISCFVDSDHAGCRITRRSRTGILIYVNKAPILWYSKLQNTVETSTFGAEFVAMRQAIEMIKGLKYKLQMFGIEILENETKIYCDNNSVVLNSSIPESKLKKKHNSVNFHFVRESVASGLALVFKVDTNENLADMFTKILDKVKRIKLIKKILR